MNFFRWSWLKQLQAALDTPKPDPVKHTARIVSLQRRFILPLRLLVVAIAIYHLYTSPWLSNAVTSYAVVFETIQDGFRYYILFVLAVTTLLYVAKKFPPRATMGLLFAVGLADGLFLGALTLLTGGFTSILYWGFAALIVTNVVIFPFATPQIFLNLALAIIFMGAGAIETNVPMNLDLPALPKRAGITANEIQDPLKIAAWVNDIPEPFRKSIYRRIQPQTFDAISNSIASGVEDEKLRVLLAAEANRIAAPVLIKEPPPPGTRQDLAELSADPNVLRGAVLVLLTFCCYGVQLLIGHERRIVEAREQFVVRTEQLRSAGRLAAEIAHQIKNPLTVINNVTFMLKNSAAGEKPEDSQQIEIIQEEVAKADRVITQIMNYAQLTEGRVQRINVVEEINRAIADVFPPAMTTGTKITRAFAETFPELLMQPRHFTDAVSNLIQNARDAVAGAGEISISAKTRDDFAVEIVVSDTGPGIAPDKIERIFEAYYTTKPRGSGLGLAVVKHNAELYGGSVRVESELGKGARFTLIFPAKTFCELT